MVASVLVVGGLIMGAVRPPVIWAIAVVGLFAAFHGHAHALEAPSTGSPATSACAPWGASFWRPERSS